MGTYDDDDVRDVNGTPNGQPKADHDNGDAAWNRRTADLINRVSLAMLPFRGQFLVSKVAVQMAVSVYRAVPSMSLNDLLASCYPRVLHGQVITDAMINERARNIAAVCLMDQANRGERP